MKYPESIPNYGSHENWTHENLFNICIGIGKTKEYYDDFEFIKAYYHQINPILEMHSHEHS